MMMSPEFTFINWLKTCLDDQELPGEYAHRLMMHSDRTLPKVFPDDSRKAAVLLLLYPNGPSYNIVLIERATYNGHHSGQIAFPGGQSEATDASLWHTAIRESQEEIHLLEPVQLVGAASPLYIPVSRFILYPFIGFINHRPVLHPSHTEVARIIEVTLDDLFRKKSDRNISVGPNVYVSSRVYNLDHDQYIWGATAMVLSELEVLYKKFQQQDISPR